MEASTLFLSFFFLDFEELPPQQASSPLKCLIVSHIPKATLINKIIAIIILLIFQTSLNYPMITSNSIIPAKPTIKAIVVLFV